jgi:hypothetical protein
MREPCYKCKFEDKPITAEPCDHCSDVCIKTGDHPAFQYAKPITNYDRIISKTPEELAGWLDRIRLCCTTDLCGRSCPLSGICYSNAESPKETIDWLKQEVTE